LLLFLILTNLSLIKEKPDNKSIYVFFKVKLFNNTKKTLNINFSISKYSTDPFLNTSKEMSYRIVLYSISNEIFNYMKSTSKSHEGSMNLFSEPVGVYTNIKNGIGIFGGISSQYLLLK